jgi:anthranilate synthase component 2
VASNINVISKDKIFNNCPQKFLAGRYHSWLINELTIHPNLIVTAIDDQNNIMAIKHKFYNVRGVQFHPESILSEYGETIIKNWLSDNE